MAARKKVAKKARKRAVSKPKVATNKLMIELLDFVAEGGSVRRFCLDKGIGRTQVYERLKEPMIAEHFARARELGEDAILDEMADIADNPMLVEVADGVQEVHPDDVQARKLKLWWREKRLTWSNPSKYGQKRQVEQTTTHRVELSDQERTLRIQQLLDKARTTGPQVEVSIDDKELSK